MFVAVYFLHCVCAILATYQKPVPQKLWSERCKRNSYVLNDCNWCWCNRNEHYTCTARVCSEVDMFGHFKDTIQEMDLGMEGHGAWRSTRSSCEAGVEYRRGTVRCVCNEDGSWPNPVCRDLFRILYPVEVTADAQRFTSQSCAPTKLHLVGCNVCFCPSSGKLAAYLCTNRSCFQNDPVLTPKEATDTRAAPRIVDKQDLEIYVTCQRRKMYNIGCRRCKCVGNNRLVCDKCTTDQLAGSSKDMWSTMDKKKTLCSGNVGSAIKMDCNLCLCSSIDEMYCSTRKCLPQHEPIFNTRDRSFWSFWTWWPFKGDDEQTATTTAVPTTPAPALIDEQDCTPGTRYTNGCNNCSCGLNKDSKISICTRNSCAQSPLEDIVTNCVTDTNYEVDCSLCQCIKLDGVKYQICKENKQCKIASAKKEVRTLNLDSMHGYCEPMHMYEKSCNKCKCLANGKIAKCTTKLCVTRSSRPVTVDVVPLLQTDSEPCPKGHLYRIDCNMCFCLSNGNALCTTAKCSARWSK